MKEILFLIPAKLTRPYFAELYCECEYYIYFQHGTKYRPVWRCVPREKEEFDPTTVVDLLDREMAQSRKIKLLVVNPTADPKLTEGVARVAKDKKIPVLALSLPFHSPEVFTSKGLAIPAVVHCDSAVGTGVLADAARAELSRRWSGLLTPQVVLIPGQSGRSDSDIRLASFRAGMAKAGLRPKFVPLDPCNWQRRAACEAMKGFLRSSPGRVHVVFAANDEMALGARDAVRLPWAKSSTNCLVYGYDAIAEVRSLIDANDPNMKGTVEQDIPAMAKALAVLIDRACRGERLGSDDDVKVDPLCVLPKAVDPNLSGVRPLNLEDGSWVRIEDAAPLADVAVGSLRKARDRSDRRLDDVCIDSEDRISRLGPDGVLYFDRESLHPEPKTGPGED